MKLQSCQNCWFNGLQYGSVGLVAGFCARHQKVLNFSDETTCGMQVRKDLGLARALEVAIIHAQTFDNDKIVRLTSKEEVETDSSKSEKDIVFLRTDPVGEIVVDYGSLDSRIESLSQLKMLKTARSDLAMTSLARAYVGNCVRHGGRWTSGIHLYWWTKKRLSEIPNFEVNDMRYEGSIQLSRHLELAKWSLMMFRLSFIDDIIQYARKEDDNIGRVEDVLNGAATAVQNFNVVRLSRWIRKDLIPALETQLNYQRYSSLARELHKDAASSNEVG